MSDSLLLLTALIPGIILVVLIMRRPYLGLVATAASLPVSTLLPQVGLFTSLVSLLGLLTFVAYVLNRLTQRGKPMLRLGSIGVLGLVFIAWIFATNPSAAWQGETRNWVLTYFQLWIAAWLTSELLDTPHEHHVLMVCYSIAAVASAIAAIAGASIGASVYSSLRVPGFTDGANTASRYFVVGLVFLVYLRSMSNRGLRRLLLLGAIAILVAGTIATVSRTGMMLLLAATGLLIALGAPARGRVPLVFAVSVGVLLLTLLSDNIGAIMGAILPAVVQGTDTIGLRYRLWEGGLRMFMAHPFLGVGIGQFPVQLRYYARGLLSGSFLSLVTHNMYIQVLAETGLPGFLIFVAILGTALRNIWLAGRSKEQHGASIWMPWFIAFAVMLLGGMTKSDQFDKFVWLGIGVGWHFQNVRAEEAQSNAAALTLTGPRQSTADFSVARHATLDGRQGNGQA